MVARWDPFAEMTSMRDAVNRLVNESWSRPTGLTGASTVPFDLYESGDDIFVRIAAAGLEADRLDLMVNHGVLTVKGHRQFYTGDDEKGYTWHVRTLSEGAVQFAVSLPAAVNPDGAEASYDNGILTIRLPKAETVKAKRIAIKGATGQEALPPASR